MSGERPAADVLARILATKRKEVAAAQAARPLAALREQARSAPPARDFVAALRRRIGYDHVNRCRGGR